MKIYELILSMFYRIVKGDKRYKYYRKLRLDLNLTRNEVLKIQNINIQKLINHAYNNTVFYKDLFDENKINPKEILTIEDLNKIPQLTKQIIKENIEKLKSKDSFGENLVKVVSGGSSGEQAVIYISQYYEQMSRASWLRNNSIVGWMPSDKSVWIWGSPIEHANLEQSLMGRLGLLLNRRIILNAFNYSNSDFYKWYNKIITFKPTVLYGYSSIILEFSEFIIQNEMKIPSIKMVVTTSEKLLNREIIEKAFNSPVYDQYGCREVLAIGIEIEKESMLLTDDVVLLNTNENNEFLITPLYSFGFPLINYKVGDVGETNKIENTEVYPFPNMNLKIGRITDNFLNKNNNKVSTSALSTYMSTLNLGIKEHQIIQTDYKTFEINFISLSDTNNEIYSKKVKSCLEEYFGENLSLKFNNILKISSEKSGKKLMFKRTFNLEI